MRSIFKSGRSSDMKRFILSVNSVIIAAALLLVCNISEAQEKITVMNPEIASAMVDRIPLAERLDSIQNKTIYLVDVNWGGPDAAYGVFEEMQAWFSENRPDVKTVIRRKKGMYDQEDRELWKEISEKGDAAVIGISG
jgi:hypothetical protein